MPSRQEASKRKGYTLERHSLIALTRFFPRLERRGSQGYPEQVDLEQRGTGEAPVRIVATRDARQPLLVTLNVADLETLMDDTRYDGAVVVECKYRQRTWIGAVYDKLAKATR